jgi:N-acetylmuramoyl-L-alanine amidase
MLPGKTLLVNRILAAGTENMGEITEIRFAVTENVPINAKCKNGVFTVTLFNTPDGAPAVSLTENPVLKSAKKSSDRAKKTATYTFDLKDPDNWYGFDVVYKGGFIIIKVKNPMKKIEGDKPLEGLTIIVDAGHGGTDPGALGFLINKNEEDLNLDIALAARTRLTAMGANVIMTRERDETVDIYKRMDMYNEINPDLLLSVHHNSLGDAQDNSRVRGYLGLYCDDSGRLLAKACSNVISSELNRAEREVRYQALAMLRSHRFPATLFEMSFITNPDEYEFGVSAEGVNRSADAVAEGVLKWIEDQQAWLK